jgi:multiple sugar transport system permease protein
VRISAASSFRNLLDRQARTIFVLPTVVIILAFSIFPLLVSAYLSLVRFQLAPGGYNLSFIGWRNYKKLLFGSEQYHFLGTFHAITPFEWLVIAAVTVSLGAALVRYLRRQKVSIPGFAGRVIAAVGLVAVAALFASTVGGSGRLGSFCVTLYYVVVGVLAQFLIGLGLAYLCTLPIRGRWFYRMVFFLPLMVTPVGIAYMFRMLADTTVGPLEPLWAVLGLREISWAADPWLARIVVVIGDTWQWVPFMFIVLLAALEGQPRDQVEAAQLDGANGWRVFRDITWPSIAPVAASVVLIRLIEAFKIVDLPNVLTNGGPGIATESMTLHAFIEWRALNLGGSSAVAYMLFFVATISCVSFFHFVVRPARGEQA